MRNHTVGVTYVRPPFYCRRLRSFYLFVSATAIMDLGKRFEEATAYASVSVSSLEPHKKISHYQVKTHFQEIRTLVCVNHTGLRLGHRPGLPAAMLQ